MPAVYIRSPGPFFSRGNVSYSSYPAGLGRGGSDPAGGDLWERLLCGFGLDFVHHTDVSNAHRLPAAFRRVPLARATNPSFLSRPMKCPRNQEKSIWHTPISDRQREVKGIVDAQAFKLQGLALPGHLGYSEHSLTVYLLANHARNR